MLTKNRAQFKTSMAKTRKESIKEEKRDEADFKVFSDGSGEGGGIGAAAILFKRGQITPVKRLMYSLGKSSKHNTYEAEAVGVLLATWLIRNHAETTGKRVSIYTDNQAIISSVENVKNSSGQYLIQAIYNSTNSLECDIKLGWISAHSDVRRNEAVDKLAKEAARGRSSPRDSLPPMLRKALPASLSATKQRYHAEILRKWESYWDTSPRRSRLNTINAEFPFNTYRNKLHKLTRRQASIITQIQIGHFPLNGYLHRIGKAESDSCPKCRETEPGNPRRESIDHFIFTCEAYEAERRELEEKVGEGNLNLEGITDSIKNMKALITFINRTKRLKEDNHQDPG